MAEFLSLEADGRVAVREGKPREHKRDLSSPTTRRPVFAIKMPTPVAKTVGMSVGMVWAC